MGFSHYWDNLVPTADLASKARKIIAESDVTICGPMGNGAPVVNPTEIALNGDETRDHDHESFILDGTGSFCKTARKPYDEVVVAILVAAIAQDNGTVLTDGRYDDWLPGIDLYERAIGPLTNLQRIKVIAAIAA